MIFRRLIDAAGILILLISLTGSLVLPVAAQAGFQDLEAQSQPLAPIDSALQEDGPQDYVIVLQAQADLSPAYAIADWEQRGRFVYETLQSVARASQADIIAELERQGVRYQSFLAGNEIYVFSGSQQSVMAVAALQGVAGLRAPVTASLTLPAFSLRLPGPNPDTDPVADSAWGIPDSKAPEFWAANGIQGEGIRVANIDTGVQYNHPSLAASYQCTGNSPGSPACWADPTGICPFGQPCDNYGHGTHTMGILVGSDDPALPHKVGMAPGARWIACKACKYSACPDLYLSYCADWLLAPGGDPSNRPHIVNNSWGSNLSNGWFHSKVLAWRAAGIFPVFSAGNYGMQCGTIGSPADYPESFAVTAHKRATRIIAGFASRGPGEFGDLSILKPDLSAPGDEIVSSYPGNNWYSSSGTSMAAPHAAGALALLWSCSTSLRADIDASFQRLQTFADPPGADQCSDLPAGAANYTYGAGYLNALAASAGLCQVGSLSGQVTDSHTGLPVHGVRITARGSGGSSASVVTAVNGSYTLALAQDSYTIAASKPGYYSSGPLNRAIQQNNNSSLNITLDPYPVQVYLPLLKR